MPAARSILQSTIARHQSYRLWLGMPRAADSLHLYSVAFLPISGSTAGLAVLDIDRHVVARLHLRRAVPWASPLSGNERVQPDYAHRRDARVSCAIPAFAGRNPPWLMGLHTDCPQPTCSRAASRSLTSSTSTPITPAGNRGGSRISTSMSESTRTRRSSRARNSLRLAPCQRLSRRTQISAKA